MEHRALVAELKARIEDGSLAPDGRLPAERELADRLAVGRGALRRALAELAEEGRLWRHVGRGTYLAEAQPAARALPRLAATSPAEVMEARALIEPRLAALAALRATPAELRAMAGLVERGRQAADSTAAFEGWDSRFHRAIARTAGNALLLDLFDLANAARGGKLWGRLKAASLNRERAQLYCDQHAAILAALVDREAERAAGAMSEHLETVTRHLFR